MKYERGRLLCRNMGRWTVVRVRTLWHIVFQVFSAALWDMRTADVMLKAVGWDFTGFLCSFTMPVTEGLKNALAPGAAQVILRNRGASPV